MLSIGVALLVMTLKYLAYAVTGSAALYSDALESIVNLITAAVAVASSSSPPLRPAIVYSRPIPTQRPRPCAPCVLISSNG